MLKILPFILLFGHLSSAFAQEWEIVSQNEMFITEISFADPEFGMALGAGYNLVPTVYITEDGGYTWTPTLEVDTAYIGPWTALEVSSRTNALAAAMHNGKVYKYDGSTWHLIQTGTTDQINDFYFYDDQNGYAVGQYGLLLKTTDGGETWSPLPQITDTDIQEIDGSGPMHLKVISSVAWPKEARGNGKVDPWFGYVYTSHTGGLTWYEQYYTNYMFYGISMINDSTSFVCGDYYPGGGMSNKPFIWEIENYFISKPWYYGYFHPYLQDIDFASQEAGVVVGSDGFISRFYSGEWHDEISPTTVDLSSVCVLEDTVRTRNGIVRQIYAWASGDSGTVLMFTETIVGQQEQSIPPEQGFIYPNPFERNINLKLLNGMKPFVLKIYDLNGWTLLSFDSEFQSIQEIDLGFLDSGVYIARLTTPGRVLTQKIIKIR
jgi:hypothetical protein